MRLARPVSSLFALAALAAPALVAVAACSSASTGATGTDAGDADAGVTVSCQDDPRVDVYVANLKKTSAAGMSVTLVSSDPAPPLRGTNTWTVKLADPQGNAVTGASLTVSPFMPDHGHGTSIVPQVTANPDGSYTITPLYFFMPGVWRVSIGTGTDAVDFFFCVAG